MAFRSSRLRGARSSSSGGKCRFRAHAATASCSRLTRSSAVIADTFCAAPLFVSICRGACPVMCSSLKAVSSFNWAENIGSRLPSTLSRTCLAEQNSSPRKNAGPDQRSGNLHTGSVFRIVDLSDGFHCIADIRQAGLTRDENEVAPLKSFQGQSGRAARKVDQNDIVICFRLPQCRQNVSLVHGWNETVNP